MTHKDIYTKFMIEYDKANVTSSYPSLTEYEVATVLDKAYHALIAQKVTGNNVRRSTFESDVKSIADLGPLTMSKDIAISTSGAPAPNAVTGTVPTDLLYFLQAYMQYKGDSTKQGYTSYEGAYDPLDGVETRKLPVKLANHETAMRFFSSAYNMPWVKTPVCYIEDKKICVVYDPLNSPITDGKTLTLTYIKVPNLFVKELPTPDTGYNTYFDYSSDLANTTFDDGGGLTYKQRYEFECSGTVAEELISLAVAFALENVESTRLNSKLNMRGLEA